MRMIRLMNEITRKDKWRNEYVRGLVRIVPIEDKLRENRLRWFGHVHRRPLDAPVRRLESMHIDKSKRGRGRPKITWEGRSIKKRYEFNWIK